MRIRGRKEIFPYALFEALKVRDHRLEPVPHNSFYNSNPKGFEPQKGAEKIRSHHISIFFYFSISLILVVIVGLQRQGLLSLSFAS